MFHKSQRKDKVQRKTYGLLNLSIYQYRYDLRLQSRITLSRTQAQNIDPKVVKTLT